MPTAAISSSSSPPAMLSRVGRSIAVIGAGAAGIVAARELRREGHGVVVYERTRHVGGTWVYTPAVESDPLSIDPTRHVIQTSLYASLRTNLPRECMGFLDYPFIVRPNSVDRRRFPCHEEVMKYLESFSKDFGVYDLVMFGREVVKVEMADEGKWKVRSKDVEDGEDDRNDVYDGVVVCNGHFTEPRLAEIPGIDTWPGKQLHSHNYRVPEPFQDQVVIIIGNASSGADISRDISKFAKEVHIAVRSAADTPIKMHGHDNMWLHSMIESAHNDGSIAFQDGSSVHANIIMHCTGYKYHFPFLDTNGIVNVDDNRVSPLYKHILPPSLAPFLSFVGLPFKVAPFPMYELQSKWVAGILSGRIALPTEEEMMEDVKAYYSEMESAGRPKRDAHNLGGRQFDYDDWLAAECGYPPIEEWRKEMYAATNLNRGLNIDTYRDEWDDDHLVAQANEDFQRVLYDS